MTRKKKLLLNSITSIIYQFVALVCGFVLPRMFLSTYGSEVNGLVSSITQFLGFISLSEMGVGAVIQSSLYKPLAENDSLGISKIALSSERFFRKIAYLLIGYTLLLMFIYPLKTIGDFDYFYTLFLILVISISTFAQYYFGMTYRLILTADQLGFIQFTVHSASLILNTVACVIFMKLGMTIHMVKLTSSLIFLMQPIVISIIARRRYKIDRTIVLEGEPIKQKWNGIAQHVAAVVLGNTGTIVLTVMSTLSNVSIYSVYFLVVNGVKRIVLALTNGIQAMFGNMLAKQEDKTLNRTFNLFEWLMHVIVTVSFSITAFAIVPFVTVYTAGITDTNYIIPIFGYLMALSQAIICLQLPYITIIQAAGHYKQTQWSSIIEASINVVLSVLLVWQLGLIGIPLGIIFAITYRLIYLVVYLRKNILNRKLHYFIKYFAVDILCVAAYVLTLYLSGNWFALGTTSWLSWIVLGIKLSIMCVVEALIIHLLFNYRNIRQVLTWLKANVKKKKAPTL